MDRQRLLNFGLAAVIAGMTVADVGCGSKPAATPAPQVVAATAPVPAATAPTPITAPVSAPPSPVSTEAVPAPVTANTSKPDTATKPAPAVTTTTPAKPTDPAVAMTPHKLAKPPSEIAAPKRAKAAATAAAKPAGPATAAISHTLASEPKPAPMPMPDLTKSALPAPLAKPQADVNTTASQTLVGKTSGPDVDLARAKIQVLYEKMNKGIAAEDVKKVMSVYDTDWGKVHINGKKSELGRQQNFFQRVFARMSNLHASVSIRQFALDDKVAHVIARQHWAGRTKSGKLNKVVWSYADFIVMDEWEKQPNGSWLMVSTTNLKRVKYAIDHPVKVNGFTLPEDAPNDKTPAPAPSDMLIDAVR